MKNKEKNYSEEDLKRTRVIFLLFIAAIVGIFFGTQLYMSRADKSGFASDMLSQGFIRLSTEQTVTEVFYRSLSWTSLLVIIMAFLGMSAVTQPLEIFILFFRGAALGISVSYMYGIYGTRGIMITALMILPHAVITTGVLVFAAREALRLSNFSFLSLIGKNLNESAIPDIKLYFLRFAVLLIFTLLSSVIDCAAAYFLTDKLLS